MWGGRYRRRTTEIMERINASIDFDKRLYAQDIAGSKAHCRMLVEQDIIAADGDAIMSGLDSILQDIESGSFDFKTALEDIHMNVEAALAEKIGEPAGRLHTGRSRNDQVATDFRLWTRDAIDTIDGQLQDLQRALIETAEQHAETVMPGFTHLSAGTAGDVWASSPRLCRDGWPGSGPVCRRARTRERIAAWRRRACRYRISD